MAGPSVATTFFTILLAFSPSACATLGAAAVDAQPDVKFRARNVWHSNEARDLEARGRKKKKYKGIDFSQLNKEGQVRFLLSASYEHPAVNNTPTVLNIPDCETWVNGMSDWNKVKDCYLETNLSTTALSSDPVVGRSCQAFEMINKDGGKHPLRDGGYSVAIKQANNSESEIGWTIPENKVPTWTDKVDDENPDNQIKVDCKSWWNPRKQMNAPPFYGKYCLLRLGHSNNMCITASSNSSWDNAPVTVQNCQRKNPLQEFHLWAAAREFPDFNGKGSNDQLYDSSPLSLVQNDPNRCKQSNRYKGYVYGNSTGQGGWTGCSAPLAENSATGGNITGGENTTTGGIVTILNTRI